MRIYLIKQSIDCIEKLYETSKRGLRMMRMVENYLMMMFVIEHRSSFCDFS